jgi:ribosomal subunit interface protein
MTFPNINYKYNGIEEAKSLTGVVEQKLSGLQKLIPSNAAVVCEVEFNRNTSHQHGKVCRVEVNLSINGILHRAEATENSFDEAIDRVRDELDGDLSRTKDKKDTLAKRAGRAFKGLLTRS